MIGTEISHPLAKAVILFVIHIASPWISKYLAKYDAAVNSIGGGLAITYVFLVLLPELDLGHDLFGRKIYLIVLVSFILFYGLHKLREHGTDIAHKYRISLLYSLIYNWLIIFGLPESLYDSSVHLMLVSLAIGLHLLHSDLTLAELDLKKYKRSGRWLVGMAPLIGFGTRVAFGEVSEELQNIVTALLAGSVIYSVFHQELPKVEASRFAWFVGGIVLYALIVILADLI